MEKTPGELFGDDAAAVFGLTADDVVSDVPKPKTMEQVAFSAVSKFADDLVTLRRERLAREQSGYARSVPIASDVLPDSCLRRQVLEVIAWQDKPLFGPDAQARFDLGKLMEREGIMELMKLGFDVSEQQAPFELKKGNRVVLRGRIDGKVSLPRAKVEAWLAGSGVEVEAQLFGHRGELIVPYEIKSMNPNVFARIETLADFEKYWWTRKYPPQLQSYLVGYGHPAGFFWLTDCLGKWKAIPVPMDYDFAERVLSFAESASDAIAAAQEDPANLPPFSKDPEECARCPFFKRTCQPEFENGGAVLLDEEALLPVLELREKWKHLAKLFEKADDFAKGEIKAAGVTMALCGGFAIQVKEKKVKAEKEPRPARVDQVVTITRLAPGGGTEPEDDT